MENKMPTPLRTSFSTAKNQQSQYDVRSTAETLVIYFDQEKF